MSLAVVAGVAGLVFLYFRNPADVAGFPRCPFLVLTGLKCPGCGTLRGIHHLLHLQMVRAWQMNPLMLVSIPLITVFLLSRRIRENALVGKVIWIAVVVYWVLRNLG